MKKFIPLAEVAAKTGVPLTTIYSWSANGWLPLTEVSERMRFMKLEHLLLLKEVLSTEGREAVRNGRLIDLAE